MGHKLGYGVNIISCLYIIVFVVIYCFPYSLPVTAVNMNYACLITGSMSIFAALWWFVKGGNYVGPKETAHEDESHSAGIVAPAEEPIPAKE
jgi:choline transport protein